jgi:hypothetical protein
MNKVQQEEGAYKVPSKKGGYLNAIPMKMALKYDPPAIFVVYQFAKSKRKKKYIHEVKVIFKDGKNEDLSKLAEHLMLMESIYLNPDQISKPQVSPPFLSNKSETLSKCRGGLIHIFGNLLARSLLSSLGDDPTEETAPFRIPRDR